LKTELLRSKYTERISTLDDEVKNDIEEYVNSLRLLNSLLMSETGTAKSRKLRRSMWHDGKTRWFLDDVIVAREIVAVNNQYYSYEIYDPYKEPKQLWVTAGSYKDFCETVEKELLELK